MEPDICKNWLWKKNPQFWCWIRVPKKDFWDAPFCQFKVKEKSSILFVKKINTRKSIPCDHAFKKTSLNPMKSLIRDIYVVNASASCLWGCKLKIPFESVLIQFYKVRTFDKIDDLNTSLFLNSRTHYTVECIYIFQTTVPKLILLLCR